MDTTEQEPQTPPPALYKYTAIVWVERTYEVVATDDETLEEAVKDSLMEDGLDPDAFQLVRLQTYRTPTLWQ